jgi:hypothetical protein
MSSIGSATAGAWFLLLSFFSIAASAGTDAPAVHTCPNAAVSIVAQASVDHTEICYGAEDAIAFFERLSIAPTHPLVVEIVHRLPDVVGETAVGCYLEKEQNILVLDYTEFAKSKTWFDVSVDRSLYRSLVTHEVAHAVSDCNISIPEPTIQAKEYLAYVAMFATMDRNLRERIMNRNRVEAFDRESKINTTIYLCDPMRFAVRAYRHYLNKGNGDAFLFKVLSGQALAN